MGNQELYQDGKMGNQELYGHPDGLPQSPPAPTDTLPEGFKMTELGPLPEEWQVVRLGEVASFDSRSQRRSVLQTNEFPFLPMSMIPEDSLYITKWELRNIEEIRSGIPVFEGDLLLAKITPSMENGKQGIVVNLPNGWGFATTEVIPIRILNKELMTEFLAFYLKLPGIRIELANKMEGTTGRQRLPKSVVESLSIPLPPLSEQRAIAHVLRTVQESKEATERVITALKELKKSLMRHLFTYGPVPVDKTDTVQMQETEIGSIPAHWRVVRLGEVVEKTQQFDPRRRADWRFKYVDVSSISNKRLKIESYVEYMGKDAPHRARKIVKANDVIFATVRPYLKRIAIVPENLDGQIVSTAFCVLRGKFHIVDPLFIFYAVSTDDFVERVSANQHGSSYPAVTDKDILHQYISLPPLSEQQEIARILQTVDEKIAAEEKRRSALETLFKSLLAQLMSGRLRLPKQLVAQFEQEVS